MNAELNGENALNEAVAWSELKIVQLLLTKTYINANKRDRRGYPPIAVAAEAGEVELVQAMIESREDLDVNAEQCGHIALDEAFEGKYLDIIRIFMNHPRINLNVINSEGEHLLEAAIEEGWHDIRDQLLNNPTNPIISLRDDQHQTVLSRAVIQNNLEAVNLILETQIEVDLYLEYSFWDQNDSNPQVDRWTLLHICAAGGRTEVLQVLLKHLGEGTYFCAQEDHGRTVIHLAVKYKRLETLKLLLEKGAAACINTADVDGLTALHIAAQNGDIDRARLLLHHGADTSITSNGATAADLAIKSGHTDVAESIRGSTS
ncbi:ankyrin repeat-containing domain protein [Aspergillus filifer]